MIGALLTVSLALIWMLKETDWLRARYLVGKDRQPVSEQDIGNLANQYRLKPYSTPLCGWEWLRDYRHPTDIEYHIELNAHGVKSVMTLKAPEAKLLKEIATATLHNRRNGKRKVKAWNYQAV